MYHTNTEFWTNEVKRLSRILDKAKAAHDTYTFDQNYAEYLKAQEKYREAVLEQCPFTGWGL